MNRRVRHALRGAFIASLITIGTAPVWSAPVEASASAQAAMPAPLEKQALEWLAQLDGKDYQASLKSAAAAFRAKVTPEKWEEGVKQLRSMLGETKSRKLVSTQRQTNPEGAPKGEYQFLLFDTQFGQKTVKENVVFVKEPDGQWRVTGYFIR